MKFFNEEPSFDIVGKIPVFWKASGTVVTVCIALLGGCGPKLWN